MLCLFFFFKQKTAYEMRISDWSSDVCSSDLSIGCGRTESDYYSMSFNKDRRGHRGRGKRDDFGNFDSFEPAPYGGDSFGAAPRGGGFGDRGEIGRASWRASVCPYV